MKIPAPSHESLAPVRYVLPWPPSVNHYWRIFVPKRGQGRARMIVSEDGRKYRGDVMAAVWSERRREKLKGRVELTLILFQRRSGPLCDLDNFSKGVLDALAKAGVYANDNQIDALHVLRGERTDQARAEVLIRAM